MGPSEVWKDLAPGAIVKDWGNAAGHRTGTWRTTFPSLDLARCTHCLICWIYCPDNSIVIKDSRMLEIDLWHCKGCGICAVECPTRAITMIEEPHLTSVVPEGVLPASEEEQ